MSDAQDDGGTVVPDVTLASGRDGVVIRRAEPADLPAVLAMKAAAWREAYGALRPAAFFDEVEATMPSQVTHWRALLDSGAVVWTAVDGAGDVVGVACAEPWASRRSHVRIRPEEPDVEVELTTLYLLARVHGSGLADLLLERAVGRASARLSVLTENPRARAFYRRHGFREVGAEVELPGAWAGLHETVMTRPAQG